MRSIDIETWERREHFFFFQNRLRPQLEITTRVVVTGAVEYRRGLEARERPRLSDMLYFLAARAANGIAEFRTRLVDRAPVEFSSVRMGFTYRPAGRSLHANCVAAYSESFPEVVRGITAARREADRRPTLTPAGAEGQDMLYLSIIPGVVFSSITNPWGDPWSDSVPRIIFGQLVEPAPGVYEVPVSIEALHSFVDGIHVQKFLDAMTGLAASAETFA